MQLLQQGTGGRAVHVDHRGRLGDVRGHGLMLSTAPGERSGAVTLPGVSHDPDRAHLFHGLSRAVRRPWRLNEATRLSIDSLAQRYGADRGLSHQTAGATPPATWFLETVVPAKSHSFLQRGAGGRRRGRALLRGAGDSRQARPADGGLDGGALRAASGGRARLWHRLPVPAGRRQGWPPAAARWRRPAASLSSRSTRGSTSASSLRSPMTIGEPLARLFTDEFIAWLDRLPWRPTGAEVMRFELRNGGLCVYAKPKARSATALDAFGGRAAVSPLGSSRRRATRLEPDLGAHHHRAVGRQAEVGDRAGGVACHGDEQRLAPAAHARGVGRRDRDLGDEVGGVLEVEVALSSPRLRAWASAAGMSVASW